MKLDFNQLRRLKDSFHQQFAEGGDLSSQLDDGSMVYSIHFDPHESSCKVHVQWPYFRNLVANEADCAASFEECGSDGAVWLYWTCKVQGIVITACMFREDLFQELRAINAEFSETEELPVLLAMWQDLSGWNRGD